MLTQEQYNQFKLQFPLDSLKTAALREESFQSYLKVGLPSKKDEAWKYTSVNDFKNQTWQIPLEEELLTHDEMKWISGQLSSDFYNFVFINGFLNRTLSDDLDSSVTITEMTEADFSGKLEEPDFKLKNMAEAFSGSKVQIKISESIALDKPIQILFAQKSKDPILTQPFVDVEIGKRSSVKLIQNFLSLPGQTGHALNATMKVNVSEQANVHYVQLQNEAREHFHFSRTQFALESGAQLLSLDLALGGRISRHYFEVVFQGENAFAGVYGLTTLSANQHTDHYTFINHKIGHNQSVQHYKSILTDSSHSVFRGRVRIEQDAQKANSEQLNNNLLLTREAQADSIPQLEIYADDVKAGHGSTVGQLNADELFYFLSRGINQTQAVRMLAVGYALELVYKFEDSALQAWILKNLNEKLEGMIPNV